MNHIDFSVVCKAVSNVNMIILLLVMLLCAKGVERTAGSLFADVNVTLSSGSVIGGLQLATPNVTLYQFLSVPYAEPPVGSLRFQNPIPWKSRPFVRAASFPPFCSQVVYDHPFDITEFWRTNIFRVAMAEDCLYLNIFTTEFPSKDNKFPVLVWFHGGGFQGGYPMLSRSDAYAAQSIVSVSVAYRVGPFGFLSYQGLAPGNMGLKDQQLALRWIRDNIAAFGGDPGLVTIIGQSAGSASASYHLLSPGSSGLFVRAILHSGTANAPWGLKSLEASSALAVELKNKVCSEDEHIEDCLMNAAVDDIRKGAKEMIRPDLYYPFLPVVDGEFVPKSPLELLKAKNLNKADVIIGYADGDGWLYVDKLWPAAGESSTVKHTTLAKKIYADGLKAMLSARSDVNSPCTAKAIAHEYSRWQPPITIEKVMHSIGDMLSDAAYEAPAIEFAHYAKEAGNVYLFRFDHLSDNQKMYTAEMSAQDKTLYPSFRTKQMGVLHREDLHYVFGGHLALGLNTAADALVSKTVMKIWTNFIKTGSTTPEWPQFDPSGSQRFLIIAENLTVGQYPAWHSTRFWTEYIPSLEAKRTAEPVSTSDATQRLTTVSTDPTKRVVDASQTTEQSKSESTATGQETPTATISASTVSKKEPITGHFSGSSAVGKEASTGTASIGSEQVTKGFNETGQTPPTPKPCVCRGSCLFCIDAMVLGVLLFLAHRI